MSDNKLQNSLVMSKDDFWNLVEETRAACGDDQDKYLQSLKSRLKELGPDYAQDFHDIVRAYNYLAGKRALWTANMLMGHSSDDGFTYFRSWLISQGREAYFNALRDPDSLADLDFGDGSWFESFAYTGANAREEIDGQDAFDCTDYDIWFKLAEELRQDIEYCEGSDYPFEWDELPDYYPRLYDWFVNVGPKVYIQAREYPLWDETPEVLEARKAGPPPKPEPHKDLEMDGM